MTFATFIADKTATRVVLAEVVSTTQTHYFSNITYVTGPAESPANTVYKGRIANEVTITRMLSSVLGGNSAAANGGDLIIDNIDGNLDSIIAETFTTVTLYYGDKDDTRADFESIWSARIVDVNADDEAIRFALFDKYEILQTSAQKEINIGGDLLGEFRALPYGWVRNAPLDHEITDASAVIKANDPVYVVSENHGLEDSSETLFKNQSGVTPVVTTNNNRISIATDSDGAITADIKGIQDSSSTWITTPGEVLQHLLTRKSKSLTGIVQTGTTTTVRLDDQASDQDDEYNGLEIWKYDAANDTIEGSTIIDYVGATREATTGTWSVSATAGDGYEIFLGSNDQQLGPFATSDLDTASFTQLDTDLPYRQNLFINDNRTFVEVLNEVLGPGAYHYFSKTGLLTVGVLTDPSGETADFELTRNQLYGRVRLVRKIKPAWRLRLGFRRNYAPTSGDAGDAVNFGRIRFITKEWRYKSKIKFSTYNADPTTQDVTVHSSIDRAADADTELDRLWELFKVERSIYEVETFTEILSEDLGSIIKVTDDRLGLASGTNFVLIGIRERLMAGTTQLVLWG